MKRLTKYLIITYLALAIILLLGFTLNVLNNDYINTHIPQTTYDSQGNPQVEQIPLDNSYSRLLGIISLLLYIGFPFFVVFMSALYLFKEKEGYFKGLLISGSFVIVGTIISFIWWLFFASGEEGMAIAFLLPWLILTLIISLITNAIVLVIAKKGLTWQKLSIFGKILIILGLVLLLVGFALFPRLFT